MITAQAKRTPAASPAEESFRTLVRIFGLLERVSQPYFRRFGITGSQWGVLRTLVRAEESGEVSLRLGDLSRRLLVRPPSVTGVANRMERLGLVVRTTSTADQRGKHLALTPRGRDLVAKVVAAGHQERYERLMGAFSRDEQVHLSALLQRLNTHLEGLLETSDE